MDDDGNYWTSLLNLSDKYSTQSFFLISTSGDILQSNVTCSSSSTSWLFYDQMLYNVRTDGGYLYSYNSSTKACNRDWSFSGHYGASCDMAVDVPTKKFTTVCPDGITSFSYLQKATKTIPNPYNVISIAFDPKTENYYCLARAAGNLLLYELDQALNWIFINVIWGFDLVNPIRTIVHTPGQLTFVATDQFSTYLVTVDVSTGVVINQPILSAPVATFC